MRTIRFDEFGEPGEVLRLEEAPLPEPGPGQVRVRLTHRPINPSDLSTIRGEYGRLPTLPATPGLESVGVIDALGKEVSGFRKGQRVIPLGLNGTWREYGVVDALRLIPVPDALSDESAAQFVANPVTAWVMLEEELALEEGDWVLQTAAGSTLGRLVLQLAQHNGYKTVNFVRRREQVQELLDLGADAVICTEDDDVVTQVQALTGGKGVTGAIEAVGGRTGELAAHCLRPGGTMIVYGMLSGEPMAIHGGEFLFKGLTLRGFWLTYWIQSTPPAKTLGVMAQLMELMTQGELTPPVEATYDLADFVQAVEHAETPGRSGKVLLTG